MKLKDKVSVITGGSKGIGASIARLFASEGSKVALIDIDEINGEKCCKEINKTEEICKFYKADVSKEMEVKKACESLIEFYRKVDILVNNAGIWRPGRVVDLNEKTWDVVLNTNLKSVFLVSKYILPIMIESKGGVVINVASVAGLVGAPEASAYAASKGGIVNLSRSMALDFAKYNIRVNCLCPGMVDTDQGDSVVKYYKPELNPKEAKKLWQPLTYLGKPDDVAKAALYIASDDASFMTGSIFVIDGGLTAQ